MVSWVGESSLTLGVLRRSRKIYLYYNSRTKIQTFQIRLLAKYLNLTLTHVNQHETVLYELDSKLLIINKNPTGFADCSLLHEI